MARLGAGMKIGLIHPAREAISHRPMNAANTSGPTTPTGLGWKSAAPIGYRRRR